VLFVFDAGGGGGAGAVTDTVAVAGVLPFGPTAVSVYVVVSFGVIRRLPLAGTVPIPLLIETSVEPVTFHRNCADWPRSIEEGSAANSATTGRSDKLPTGPLPALPVAGGGGGGKGAFLPPQAAAKIASKNVRKKPVNLEIRTRE
jgi:hypothetical protein